MKSKLLRGSLETIVVKLLSDKGEMYGYEISKEVKLLTDGEIELTEGALYPTLHKLEGKGLLSVETRPTANRIRKYYRITPQGKSSLVTMLEEMENYMRTMNLILKPGYGK